MKFVPLDEIGGPSLEPLYRHFLFSCLGHRCKALHFIVLSLLAWRGWLAVERHGSRWLDGLGDFMLNQVLLGRDWLLLRRLVPLGAGIGLALVEGLVLSECQVALLCLLGQVS